jgi:hypothetical protein
MRYVKSFGFFWYDFVVGDDPVVAIGVVIALIATAGLVALHVPAWWLLPLAVTALLAVSLRRATRPRR